MINVRIVLRPNPSIDEENQKVKHQKENAEQISFE